MKSLRNKILATLVALALLECFTGPAHAQGTAFSYQGKLSRGPTALTGSHDFRFMIFDAPVDGHQVASTITLAGVGVINGLFTVTLDFGENVFTGAPRFLDIGVIATGSGASFVSMTPRQTLTATPYAITAGALSSPLAGGSLSGAYSNAVTFNNATNVFTGSFSGDGGGLSNLNISAIGPAGAFSQAPLRIGSSMQTYLSRNFAGALAVADFDGDGFPDFIVAGSVDAVSSKDNNLNFYRNNRDGSFALVDYGPSADFDHSPLLETSYPVQDLVAADLNLDGKPDLLVTMPLSVLVLTNTGGNFKAGASLSRPGTPVVFPRQSIVADFNGDGLPDVASLGISLGAACTVDVFTNSGKGTFIYATTPFLSESSHPITFSFIAAVDVNGDGSPEIAATDGEHNRLYVLRPYFGGAMIDASIISVGANPNSVVALDANRDGFLDLATANMGGHSVTILTNDGSGNFSLGTTIPTGGAAGLLKTADVNLDGYDDLIVAVQPSDEQPYFASLFLNDKLGHFNSSGVVGGTISPHFFLADTLAIADLNLDGAPDFVLSHAGSLDGADSSRFTVALSQVPDIGISSALALTNNANEIAGIFSGSLKLSPGGQLRLNDQPLYLRGGESQNDGLVFGGTGFFSPSVQPNGPVLWGADGGALATSTIHGGFAGSQIYPRPAGILYWTSSGVGILTNRPQATLDVNGTFRVNNGTTLTNYLAGQARTEGGSSGNKAHFTITFPKAFNGIPKVVATVDADPAFSDVDDTFVISLRSVSSTNCVVNVVRVDATTGWSQSIRVNWTAWE